MNGAQLLAANLTKAKLTGADLANAILSATILVGLDLREPNGLEDIEHQGPSFIGIETLYNSQGQIPDKFLKDAGVPDEVVDVLLPIIRKGSSACT